MKISPVAPSKLLEEIAELIGKPAPRAFVGKVTAIEADAVTVSSPAGRARAARPATLILSVGDEVLVSDGVVQARVKRSDDVQTYQL